MGLGPDRAFPFFPHHLKKYKVENFRRIGPMLAQSDVSWENHQAGSGDEKKI